MPTRSAIPTSRADDVALQYTKDDIWVRDDKLFMLGTDGDFGLEYDENGNNVVRAEGADIRLSDTQTLQFGDGGDVTMTWNGAQLVITGLPTSNPGVAGAVWISGSDLKIHA